MLSDPAGVGTPSSRWRLVFCGRQRRGFSSRSQETALPEPMEWGTANTLALEPCQALPVALHRASTPGQGAPGFDRVIVVAQPVGNPLSGPVGTLRRPREPGRQLVRLAFAHEPRNVLNKSHYTRAQASWGMS